MKNLFLSLLMVFSSKLFTRTAATGLFFYVAKSYSQTLVWASITGTKNCMLYKQLSPTSDYGNRWNVIYINKDSLIFRHPHVYQDSLKLRNDILVGSGKIMWMDNTTGHMNASRLDSLRINWNHINSRPTNLSAFTNGPGYLTGADTVGKWMPHGTYDRSDTNEIQKLSYSSGVLSLTPGTGINIPIPPAQYNPSAGDGISITGSYPNHTVTNTGVKVESDPTVSAAAKGISGSDVSNWNGKMNQPSGTTGQYLRGDGSLATFPSIPSTQTLVSGSGINILGANPYTVSSTNTLTSITGSTGISVSGGTITNSLPDRTVTLSGAGITTITGTYPNFTCSATVPASTLSVNGSSLSISNGNTVQVPNPVTYYNASGTVTAVTKVWSAIITPTASNSYTVNISSAGFSNITNVQVVASKNSSSPTNCPNPCIKSFTNSQLVINVIEGNASTVNLLGSLVLLGAANIFADVTGLTLHVRVEGN